VTGHRQPWRSLAGKAKPSPAPGRAACTSTLPSELKEGGLSRSSTGPRLLLDCGVCSCRRALEEQSISPVCRPLGRDVSFVASSPSQKTLTLRFLTFASDRAGRHPVKNLTPGPRREEEPPPRRSPKVVANPRPSLQTKAGYCFQLVAWQATYSLEL